MTNLFNKIRLWFSFLRYLVVDGMVKSVAPVRPKTLLLVRTDAIGDYILFRNFIEIVRKSPQYQGYRISLLGNLAWKSLALELDADLVDEFIWIDWRRFHLDMPYRYKTMKSICQEGYEVVINAAYSRDFICSDAIVRKVSAKEKIGSTGDLSNNTGIYKSFTDKAYTQLIPSQEDVLFEFFRNKEFFEKLLQQPLDIRKPSITKDWDRTLKLPKKYALLFIGASRPSRKWDAKHFATIAHFLVEKYQYEIVLCGSNDDVSLAEIFEQNYTASFTNLVGKTTLIELLQVVQHSDFLLSNETSVPHFAVALGVSQIFVLYNGNHFGRFVPYPTNICPNYHLILHPEIEKNTAFYTSLSNSERYVTELDINKISVNQVKEAIQKAL